MKLPKIALIGADGQLGTDLYAQLRSQAEVTPLYYPDFDLKMPEMAKKGLADLSAKIVINTAAFNRVDDCEERPEDALALNTLAVRDLSLTCRDLGLVLVHFSTDYVFSGIKQTPYVETDEAVPQSVYGVSKLAGEFFVNSIVRRHYVIRTCGLFGVAGCWGKGNNFVDTMVSLANKGKALRIVDDQWITPTSTWELAGKVIELLEHEEYGLYHLTNEGECTWYGFAQEIFALLGKQPDVIPVDSVSYGAKAPRPAYSVLENKRAKDLGLSDFSHWKSALKDYLIKKGHI